jgi:hypothetical protein
MLNFKNLNHKDRTMKKNLLSFAFVFLLTAIASAQTNPDSVYTSCEISPMFVGGDFACQSYLVKNIVMPDDAWKKMGRCLLWN